MNVNQRLQVYKTNMVFDRRVTAMEWHPRSQNVVAVAAKSGDIVLWDYENEKNLAYIYGVSFFVFFSCYFVSYCLFHCCYY